MEHCFKFAIIDPRKVEAAMAANEALFAAPNGVLGVEVTIPALAARCGLGNIDPQHTDGLNLTAIEVALNCALPNGGATIATIRPDLDAVGAMAILSLRAKGVQLDPAMDRVMMVAESDRFSKGVWPGIRPLPTGQKPWPGSGPESKPLAAIAAAVSDFKVAIVDRVILMEKWLISGEQPEIYLHNVERDRADMVSALESGEIMVTTVAEGRVVQVISDHRAATAIGYTQAPVVMALNPAFRFQGGEPHAKFTICQYSTGFADLQSALAELKELEDGWGGSPTIIGSPQGVGSTLKMEQVLDVLSKHLL